MPRCQRCIMPARPNLIALDQEGICHHCRDYHPFRLKGEPALHELLASHRRREGQYDCIVTVSGGRDSAFTLLKLVKDYRMRVLAVNYDNPFADRQAQVNIENMIRILGVNLVRFRLRRGLHEKMLRNNLLAWLCKPSAAMVPVICIGCKIIWPRIMRIAKEYHLRCVINGGNPYEYTGFKKDLLGLHPGSGLSSTYSLNLVRLAGEALSNLAYLRPRYLPYAIAGFLYCNQYALGSRLQGARLDKIDLFHYILWDEKEVLGRIQSELDWRPPAGSQSTWRFDCRLSHLKDLMYLHTLGMTEKDDFFSQLIRDGRMSRTEALQRIELENQIHPEVIDGLFEQLDVDKNLGRRLTNMFCSTTEERCLRKEPMAHH